MDNQININPPRQALSEALGLSTEILKNIEMSEIPLTNIFLKTSRLARLLNDFDFQKIMEYEVGGYPTKPSGVQPEIWRIAKIAGRIFYKESSKDEKVNEFMYTETIGELEQIVNSGDASIAAARDPDISVSSSNPNQYVSAGIVNRRERLNLRENIRIAAKKLSSRRSFLYNYVLNKHYELKYSSIADDIFTRIRTRVDSHISELLPDAVKKFLAVYDSLLSDNPENWANAVHSCRRILQELADFLFPPIDKPRIKDVNGKPIEIKLGKDNYINRLIAFVEDNTDSMRFQELVGSQLGYLGDRLDSIFAATQKGSHSSVSKEEADRYVVYTYLIVGDLLLLANKRGVS